MLYWSLLTEAFADPTKRDVPAESTKFARGIKGSRLMITGSLADARCESLSTRLLRFTLCRWRKPSYEKKKNSFSLIIGPPSCPPNWLRLNGGGSVEVKVKKLRASSASFRKNSNSSPWNSLLPDRVAILTTAPALWPCSALKVELSTLNSCTAPMDGWNVIEAFVRLFSVIPLIT